MRSFSYVALALFVHALPVAYWQATRAPFLSMQAGSGLSVQLYAQTPGLAGRTPSQTAHTPSNSITHDELPRGSDAGPAGDSLGGEGASLRVTRWQHPHYPEEARRMGAEGRVLIEMDVDATGQPYNLRIATSSGHAALDHAALRALQGARFELPPGLPSARTRIALNFNLQ